MRTYKHVFLLLEFRFSLKMYFIVLYSIPKLIICKTLSSWTYSISNAQYPRASPHAPLSNPLLHLTMIMNFLSTTGSLKYDLCRGIILVYKNLWRIVTLYMKVLRDWTTSAISLKLGGSCADMIDKSKL